jgi:hypothetical protein
LGSESRPIYDVKRRIIACLVGQPHDPTYADSVEASYQFMMHAAAEAQLKQKEHARGVYSVINVGVTHGKGTKMPVTVSNHEHSDLAGSLLGNKHIQRLATFASGESES